VAALIETRDARRLLEDAPPRGGLGVDELRNLPLPHEGRRMRPRRGIGEQHLHVAGTDVLRVGLVGAARVACDPAHDVEHVAVVEARGCEAFGVVDGQHDLGEVARRAPGGAGEDHVLHPAAAHGRGAVLAHHPAQRLEQVRLAAAVGAHDAGQTVRDHHLGRVDEAFEPIEAKAGEAHFVVGSGDSAGGSVFRRARTRVNTRTPHLRYRRNLSTRC
jgi:hypothetical protein